MRFVSIICVLDPLYENNNDNYVYCTLTRRKEKILKFETIIFGFTFFFFYHTRIYYMHYVIIIGTSQQRGFHSFVGPVTFLFLVSYVLTI